MINVRKKIFEWENYTFKEMIINNVDHSKNNKTFTMECLKHLNLLENKVTGYSVEKLIKTEEGNSGVVYTNIFRKLIDANTFDPASYILSIVEELNPQINKAPETFTVQKVSGIIARGLRSLSSFLREPDFEISLIKILKKKDPSARPLREIGQDAQFHTDVYLKYKNKHFRIWLYQFSSRGLPHDMDRILGNRGKLPSGIHVLCPLSTEIAVDYEKLKKKKLRTQKFLNKYLTDLKTASPNALKRIEGLNDKIIKYKASLDDIIVKESKSKNALDEELDICAGWFLYSKSHIGRIASVVDSTIQYDTYGSVVKIISGPANYLSKTRIFEIK